MNTKIYVQFVSRMLANWLKRDIYQNCEFSGLEVSIEVLVV